MRHKRTGWTTSLGLVAVVQLMNVHSSVGQVSSGQVSNAGQAGPGLKTITTFYVVRHGEKADGEGDVPLRKEGTLRAAELRDLLSGVPLAAIYTTKFSRTRETVLPIAEASGIEPTEYWLEDRQATASWAERLIKDHSKKNVLIVGHAGDLEGKSSVASIVHQLVGKPVAEIPESEYDNLFVVTLYEHDVGDARVLHRDLQRHRYGPLRHLETLNVDGKLENEEDVSAIVATGSHLVVGSDEEGAIQTLRRVGQSQTYKVGEAFPLVDNGEEIDIESLARVGDTYYVAGSFSRKRTKVEPGHRKTLRRKVAENRLFLLNEQITDEGPRRRIYRFIFDPTSGELPKNDLPAGQRWIDIDSLLGTHPILKTFYALPSKENGIDIEGMAVDGETLVLGFRGPVLRSGYTPVLRFDPAQLATHELRFVHLDGRGIRDLVKVDSGFLIIAGAVGDAPLSYLLYHWDGNDMIPGHRGPDEPRQGRATLLGRIPTPAGAKAEGLAVLATAEDHYELLVAYDSAVNGGLRTFRAPRPAR